MKPKTSIVVFSDVDAVLKDPHLPPVAAAVSILRRVLLEDVSLVLCSSRTRAELEFIQQELGVSAPFICENGGAAFIPGGYFDFDVPIARELPGYQAVEFGRTQMEIVQTLHSTAERLRIQIVSFRDMSIEEVARECHLPLLQARLAKLREYGERFRILDPSPAPRSRLFKALNAARLRCIGGDRYDYVGAPVDSRLGVRVLDDLYRRESAAVMTIGVTDALRQENLVSLVDYPIMVSDEDAASGSVGVVDWADAIVDAVQDLRGRNVPSMSTRRGIDGSA
jgi:mannosyl-3-phosphoglycerate phosphatase family protein